MPRDGARTPEQAPATLVRRSRIGSVLWRAGSRAAGAAGAAAGTPRRFVCSPARRARSRAAARSHRPRDTGCSSAPWRERAAPCRGRTSTPHARRAQTTPRSARSLRAFSRRSAGPTICALRDAEGALRSARGLGGDARQRAARASVPPGAGALAVLARQGARSRGDPRAARAASPEPSISAERWCSDRASCARIAISPRRCGRHAMPWLSPSRLADPSPARVGSSRAGRRALARSERSNRSAPTCGRGSKPRGRGRLPLALLRLRVVLLHALVDTPEAPLEEERLRAVLERAQTTHLAGVVAQAIDAALLRPRGSRASRTASTGAGRRPSSRSFSTSRSGPEDDGEAVAEVAAAACTRVGAAACVVAASTAASSLPQGSRGAKARWQLAQVLAGGQRVLFDPRHQPPEAAEPVRCGGDLVGALACRWIAGSTGDPGAGRPTRCTPRPWPPPRTCVRCSRALRHRLPRSWGDLLGESAAAAALRDAIHRAARAPFPGADRRGERQRQGAGRAGDPPARRRGATRRFCAINCAALDRRPARGRALRPRARRVHRRR